MLPIEHDEKQSLLEIPDDGERILRVEAYLQQNGVL
jgi:Lon protease-like protein